MKLCIYAVVNSLVRRVSTILAGFREYTPSGNLQYFAFVLFYMVMIHRSEETGMYRRGYRGIYLPKLPKLNLTTDAEYVELASLLGKCQYVVVNVLECSLLHGCAKRA